LDADRAPQLKASVRLLRNSILSRTGRVTHV
jgi:hypothetical protein